VAFDAILVPGGGVRPSGELPVWVQARFDRAIETQPDGPFVALSGGTSHKPSPLDASGRPIFEAYAGAAYLLRRGIPGSRIYTEISSYDTIGNAFFARVEHTDIRGWRRLLIVNSAFHMPRTEAIFRWLFHLDPPRQYELVFQASSDAGFPAERLAARRAREAASLAAFPAIANRLRTLADVHEWMFRDHAAYAPERVVETRPDAPDLAGIY
jgi:hypothetical protein